MDNNPPEQQNTSKQGLISLIFGILLFIFGIVMAIRYNDAILLLLAMGIVIVIYLKYRK